MASVQMSKTLREEIVKNYKKKLHKTLREVNNVEPAINFITASFIENDANFRELIAMNDKYVPLAKKLEKTYPSRGYSRNFDENILTYQTEMGIVCNPKRPISDNLTFVNDWQYPYKYNNYDGKEETNEGQNFIEGDVGVSIKSITPFYLPQRTSLRYDNWRTSAYSPYAETAVIVTDPGLCEQLSPIGSIETEVAEKSETFSTWLETVTTLKKFLDDVPSGLDFVPDEYKERLQKKPKPKKKSIAPPVDIMPDSLKNTLNEVILESKLLGD
tara:strand:- start:13370 stop:14185 length:816 start_codon:yes stop_codon:yes gene_type:complete